MMIFFNFDSGIRWRSVLKYNRFFIIVLALLLYGASPSKSKRLRKDDVFLLYDSALPDYETVLTPADFEMAMEINDHPANRNKLDNDDAWDSEAMYNPEKFEGDIANDINASTVEMFIRGAPTDENSINAQYNAIRDRRQLWPNARIPYAISSQYSSYSRSVIASAMQEYSKNTCVQWAPRNANDRDYVYILPDRGCYSLVGRTGGRQTLSLGNGCIQKGIIIHEMMHAVGFFHEQSRTDRDEHIMIMWHNILPGMQGQFEKYTSATIQTLGTEYDYGSIMHYGPNAFTRNGMPTIVPKKRASIGQRSGFSKLDSYKINVLYDCPNYSTRSSGGGGAAVIASQLVAQSARPPTLAPMVVVAASTTTPQPSPFSTRLSPTGSSNIVCRNTRPDCEQLAKQGWCTRNADWMREHCPVSCGMCVASSGSLNRPIVVPSPPTSESSASSSQSSVGSNVDSGGSGNSPCEDLRVDCAELAKRRYCITAQSFSRTYCARSCGFCFVPPATETPESAGAAVTSPPLIIMAVNSTAKVATATFWPIIVSPTNPNPTLPSPSSVAGSVTGGVQRPVSFACRDRKQFCVSWKKSGFCQGIFAGYMKKHCPAACGLC